MEPLPLRDLHLPPPVGFWPPAPGWIGLFVLAVLLLIGIILWRIRRSRSLFVRAFLALEAIRNQGGDPRSQCLAFNQLLKQIAMTVLGRDPVAGLQGEKWRAFLFDQTGLEGFKAQEGFFLTEGGFSQNRVLNEDLAKVDVLVEAALKALLRGPQKRTEPKTPRGFSGFRASITRWARKPKAET